MYIVIAPRRPSSILETMARAKALGAVIHRDTPGITAPVLLQVAAPGVSVLFLPVKAKEP